MEDRVVPGQTKTFGRRSVTGKTVALQKISVLVSVVLQIVLLCQNTVSGQSTCTGTETFDKITGVTLEPAEKIPLFSAVGSTVTAECNNRCRASEDCPGFLIDYDQESCFRLETNTLNIRELITPVAGRTNYFEKVCLKAPACEMAWIFERVPGYLLAGHDDRVVGEVASRQACQELCLLEDDFECSSAEFVYATGECRLSRESRRSQPASYRASTEDVEYLENQCARSLLRDKQAISCEYDKYEDQDLGYADIQIIVESYKQCGDQCDLTSAFQCRSFTFFPSTGVCRLSGDDNISAGPAAVISRDGADYYQRSPCIDLSLSCTGESMTVSLKTEEPFVGRLFSQSSGRDCEARGNARTETELTFLFEAESAARCGVVRDAEKGVYSNIVVVQHHPVIQRKGDRAIQLYCFFQTGDKTVTNSYDVIADTIDDVDTSTPSSVLNATAPSPGVRLRITTADGRDITGTQLGEKLFLRIEMDQESIFGIFARNLKAIAGDNNEKIDLLDDRGCPTDAAIFPGLQKIGDTRDLQGAFEAFKFSDTTVVRFQVNVQFCVDECNPVDCGDGILSYGKRRRREADTVTLPSQGTTLVPETYADRLVFDPTLGQEVIYSETPLSKEIIVDPGIKVDRFTNDRVPRARSEFGPAGVIIHGEDEEGDLVCTTLPVVIATGAAVFFLQLCILVTCLLCLYTARRGNIKEREEERSMFDRQSVRSGRTSSSGSYSHPPPLTTLYHDQLTYRVNNPTGSSSRMTENSANTLKSLRTTLRD